MDTIRKLGLALAALFTIAAASPAPAHATAGFIGEYYILGVVTFGSGSTTNYAAIIFDNPGGSFNGSCNTQNNVLYVDLSTIRGRSILSTATAAMLAHTAVTAVGTNTCISSAITLPVFWARSETISWLQVSSQ